MTVGTNFIRGFNPVWSFVDLNGLQFDDTYWMWTLQNQIPYNPAAVYQDPAGTIPYTDPVQFLANGTLPVNIYWDDTQVYRLEIRQHVGLGPPTQADPLIYLVENYIPNGTGIVPGSNAGIVTDNQISNPQFSAINFNQPIVLTGVTNPPPIEVAPDWFLILQGTGNATITRIPLNTTNSTPTNAPFALRLQLSGAWASSPVLRQRFNVNGQNWQNKYAASSITAMNVGIPQQLRIRLEASNGSVIANFAQPVLSNTFTEFTDNQLINPYTNLDLPPAAYLNYSIYFPFICDVYITSLQLIISGTAQNYSYEQDTVNRQMDHLFHYYNPQLQYKPIPSFLVGWDFPMNPKQFGATGGFPLATGANTSNYAWDQTIVFQKDTNGVNVTASADGSLSLASNIGGGTQFAIIQYLEASQAIELLSNRISVFISALSSTPVTATISLFYTAGTALPDLKSPNFKSIVATLDANGGVATFNQPTAGTWTAVPRGDLGPAQFVISNNYPYVDNQFNGWQITDGSNVSAKFFAIVIGFSSLNSPDSVTINAVGLNAGDIATRPAPQSYQQTLTDCEYYYEKSYESATAPGSITNTNRLNSEMGLEIGPNPGPTDTFGSNSSFDLQYRTLKRTSIPNVVLYAVDTGAANNVTAILLKWGNGAASSTVNTPTSSWTLVKGNKSAYFQQALNFSGSLTIAGWVSGGNCYISYHYVIDARLGIV